MFVFAFLVISIVAVSAGENFSKFVGLWELKYTNGGTGHYLITSCGNVYPIMGTEKGVGTLQVSDNPNFPSSAGWYMQRGVYRPRVTEYLKLKNERSIEIQHYCNDGCWKRYKGKGNYCCSGKATYVGPITDAYVEYDEESKIKKEVEDAVDQNEINDKAQWRHDANDVIAEGALKRLLTKINA